MTKPFAQGIPFATKKTNISKILPMGVLLVAQSVVGSYASAQDNTLSAVVVKEKAEQAQGKDSIQAKTTTIGKGQQALRDIPQSITVVTEKLIDDRNLDTLKEALKNTAGITFLAAEGGEEDIRLRGFSLQATGDVFMDGMRDPAFYDRDTFALDRMEVLRGSASMLFGRGSTGGAVNQVSKKAHLIKENQIDITIGNHEYARIQADLNLPLENNNAIRVNAMGNKADNNGSGSEINKQGIAANLRAGIGEKHEISASLFHLNNQNGINYGLPWVRPNAQSTALDNTVIPIDPSTYFGMASDYNHGKATIANLEHIFRINPTTEIKTQFRKGEFSRDQRASAIRWNAPSNNTTPGATPGQNKPTLITGLNNNTRLYRGTNNKIQELDQLLFQSDLNAKFEGWGLQHELIAGVDFAQDKKTVFATRDASQGSQVANKAATTLGNPNDGSRVNEAARLLRVNNQYESSAWGVYAQDTVKINSVFKMVGGLRYDSLKGDYDSYANPVGLIANGTKSSYQMNVGQWSQRLGALYQPNDLHSYHISAGTSFNTSGDTYSLSKENQNLDPEKSLNFEIGAKFDSTDKRFSTRWAAFRSIKLNERNTDPLLSVVTLSGRRHVTGAELDFTGKLTPQLEVYGSLMVIPDAQVDAAAPCSKGSTCSQNTPGERVGDRPALTPLYSGTVWANYAINSKWRLGAGLNFRGNQTPTRSEFKVPAFITADLMAEFKANDYLTWKLNVSNLNNHLYADQLYPGHYVAGAGRLVQLSASIRF